MIEEIFNKHILNKEPFSGYETYADIAKEARSFAEYFGNNMVWGTVFAVMFLAGIVIVFGAVAFLVCAVAFLAGVWT